MKRKASNDPRELKGCEDLRDVGHVIVIHTREDAIMAEKDRRQLVALHGKQDGLTYRQIGELLGVSDSQAYAVYWRAVRRFLCGWLKDPRATAQNGTDT